MAANGKRASNIYQGSPSTRPYSSSGNDGPRPGAAFREHNIHMENIGKLMEPMAGMAGAHFDVDADLLACLAS